MEVEVEVEVEVGTCVDAGLGHRQDARSGDVGHDENGAQAGAQSLGLALDGALKNEIHHRNRELRLRRERNEKESTVRVRWKSWTWRRSMSDRRPRCRKSKSAPSSDVYLVFLISDSR